jgi:hypothetical protein
MSGQRIWTVCATGPVPKPIAQIRRWPSMPHLRLYRDYWNRPPSPGASPLRQMAIQSQRGWNRSSQDPFRHQSETPASAAQRPPGTASGRKNALEARRIPASTGNATETNASLDRATPSTTHRDLAKMRRDRVVPVVLWVTKATTALALWPLNRVAPGLGGQRSPVGGLPSPASRRPRSDPDWRYHQDHPAG